MKYDVIIIGAGAAGLMAMNYLSGKGYTCCMLEAAAYAGGRMRTFKKNGFANPVESGAEFVHGKLPLTLKLLKKAGIEYEAIGGKMITVQKGKWLKDEEHDPHWGEFMKKLSRLKEDCTINDFLNEHFSHEKYRSLRKAIQNFAEGFDLADITKASMLSVKTEWQHEEDKQFRMAGGYIQLTDYLLEENKKQNAEIFFNSNVSKVEHQNDGVTVYTGDNKTYAASKIIITVSAGILQSDVIQFSPGLPAVKLNADKLGFGSAIKFLLEFKFHFWQKKNEAVGFIISDEEIPTWWTQYPAESNLLTGWLGGPKAKQKSTEATETLLNEALQSLSSIFHADIEFLKDQLVHHEIFCWANEPNIAGGYSYNTLESGEAKSFFAQSINDTLFFAGEAFYDGESQGTVEAALQNGKQVAKTINKLLRKK